MLVHSLDQIINLKVKITTNIDVTITGFIYTYADEVLVLRTSANRDKADIVGENYRVINTLFIKHLQVLGSITRRNSHPLKSGFKKVPLDEFQKKLDRAIVAYGNATNPKANTNSQLLFEKLVQKWGPDTVRWQDSDIIIKNEIRLTKPYTLGKNTMHKLTRNPVHLEEIRKHLREVWLEIDSLKRGG